MVEPARQKIQQRFQWSLATNLVVVTIVAGHFWLARSAPETATILASAVAATSAIWIARVICRFSRPASSAFGIITALTVSAAFFTAVECESVWSGDPWLYYAFQGATRGFLVGVAMVLVYGTPLLVCQPQFVCLTDILLKFMGMRPLRIKRLVVCCTVGVVFAAPASAALVHADVSRFVGLLSCLWFTSTAIGIVRTDGRGVKCLLASTAGGMIGATAVAFYIRLHSTLSFPTWYSPWCLIILGGMAGCVVGAVARAVTEGITLRYRHQQTVTAARTFH